MKPSFNDNIALFWAKSNNRTRGQFECDVAWFCFVLFCFVLISFVHMHDAVVVPNCKMIANYCKMSTKNVNNHK